MVIFITSKLFIKTLNNNIKYLTLSKGVFYDENFRPIFSLSSDYSFDSDIPLGERKYVYYCEDNCGGKIVVSNECPLPNSITGCYFLGVVYNDNGNLGLRTYLENDINYYRNCEFYLQELLSNVEIFENGKLYLTNQIVIFNGLICVCQRDHVANGFISNFWMVLNYSGFSGFSGFSGEVGASEYSGFSGFSGFSGESGYSGFSGFSGESGQSGFSGFSGESGQSGFSGFSGESGQSGFSGFSGESGQSGFSGFSGESGQSGFSGFSGESGQSGFSGFSGESGQSGFSGFSGESGQSGFSGFSGESGYSGFSGICDCSGFIKLNGGSPDYTGHPIVMDPEGYISESETGGGDGYYYPLPNVYSSDVYMVLVYPKRYVDIAAFYTHSISNLVEKDGVNGKIKCGSSTPPSSTIEAYVISFKVT